MKKKIIKQAFFGSIMVIIITILVVFYLTNLDFANEMYFKCLDAKTNDISFENIYSDSYEVIKDCESVKSNSFFKKSEYDDCIKNETIKMGNSLDTYIEYLYGGYNKGNGCSGYYQCKPYEYFLKLYNDENEAFLSASRKRDNKCLSNIVKK